MRLYLYCEVWAKAVSQVRVRPFMGSFAFFVWAGDHQQCCALSLHSMWPLPTRARTPSPPPHAAGARALHGRCQGRTGGPQGSQARGQARRPKAAPTARAWEVRGAGHRCTVRRFLYSVFVNTALFLEPPRQPGPGKYMELVIDAR